MGPWTWADAPLAAAGALVALLTLLPHGKGTAWGAPLAVLAVLRWPALASPLRLGGAALVVAVGIELLQWALPLGRVVSPVDAVLNTLGALLAGMAAAALSTPARATTS